MPASIVYIKHFIRDMVGMYPYKDTSEIIFVELIANALDSKATRIALELDEKRNVFTLSDNGVGMSKEDFSEYHNIAIQAKVKGKGIGFAGLGAKMSFDIADRVVTHTKNENYCGGTEWGFNTEDVLNWDYIPGDESMQIGTRVQVNIKPNNSFRTDLLQLLRHHFFPLLDRNFLDLYSHDRIYSKDLRFSINGVEIEPILIEEDLQLKHVHHAEIKVGNKKIGRAVFGIAPKDYPLGPDRVGVSFCTFGKVIKSDMMQQSVGEFLPRIVALVEIPELVGYLTSNKTTFSERDGNSVRYHQLFEAVRYAYKLWLQDQGFLQTRVSVNKDSLRLEREFNKLLKDLPFLGDLFLPPKPVSQLSTENSGRTIGEPIIVSPAVESGPVKQAGGKERGDPLPQDPTPPEEIVTPQPETKTEDKGKKSEIKRKPKGPRVGFDEWESKELSKLEGGTIWINSAHPAFKKNSTATARYLHGLLSISCALLREKSARDETPDLYLIDQIMHSWGKAQ